MRRSEPISDLRSPICDVRSPIAHRRSHIRPGFTLVEVLMAMLILAIGLVAIASVFPVAGYLQKQANDDVVAMHVSSQARATLTASPIDFSGFVLPSSQNVVALPATLLDSSVSVDKVEWPVRNRCFPTAFDLDHDGKYNEPAGNVVSGAVTIGGNPDPDTGAPDPEDSDFDQRRAYWVPLVQNTGTLADPVWRVFIFILGKRSDAKYTTSITGASLANPGDGDAVPKVVRLNVSSTPQYNNENDANHPNTSTIGVNHNGNLQAGDMVLTSHGRILRITDVDDSNIYVNGDISPAAMPTGTPSLTGVWFGLPPQSNNTPAGPSSTLRILALGQEVIK